MTLKVFVDESGSGDPPVYVMAGYISRAEQWALFNDEWTEVLSERPAIPAFHMVDHWGSEDGRRRLPRLIQIIKKNVISGIALTVSQQDYEDSVKGRISRKLDSPYGFLYHSIISMAVIWQTRLGISEQMDFIFDEQHTQSDYLQSIHSKIMDSFGPEVKSRMGNRPIHADDKQMPPLQAADILAWSLRRMAAAEIAGEQVDDVIRPLFQGVAMFHLHLTKEYLVDFVKHINERNRKDLAMTESQYEAALPYRDYFITDFNRFKIEKASPGDTIPLNSFPAKQTKRFRLVHTCPHVHTPHLHRRATDECLGA